MRRAQEAQNRMGGSTEPLLRRPTNGRDRSAQEATVRVEARCPTSQA